MASKRAPARGAGSSSGPEDGVNIQVILRCRPATKDETASRTPQVVKCNEALREITLDQTVGGKQFGRTYHFDRVFPGETSQEKLYVSTVAPLVEEMLEGFSCTIFAYGQTGTGKTYTMTGDLREGSAEMSASAGVIPRAIHQIFEYLEGLGAQEYAVKASYLELYNEEVTDLLAIGADPPKVRILEDRGGVVLNGLEEAQVRTAPDIYALLDQGTAKRRTAETLLNKQSSRSHTVFVVTVSVRETLAEGEEVLRVGRLYLVDLAGSENVTRSGAVDQRAKEAGNINKSLLTLGRVITALVEGQGHVPYRDSKLTRLLRDSLGGRTKTCIIATVAPTVQCQEETLSTLEYAHRAKNIKNRPEVNQRISKTTHIKEMSVEIEKLRLMLCATREKNGVYLPVAQYEEETAERAFLRDRVAELEAGLEMAKSDAEAERAALLRRAEAQRAELTRAVEEKKAALARVEAELAATAARLDEARHVAAERARAEAALAAHALALTAELSSARRDVAQLFARVDAKAGLERDNWALVSELRAQALEALAGTAARVHEAEREVLEALRPGRAACEARRDALAAGGAEEGADEKLAILLRERATAFRQAADTSLEAVAAALRRAHEAAAPTRAALLEDLKTDLRGARNASTSAGARAAEALGAIAATTAACLARDRAEAAERAAEVAALGEAGAGPLRLAAGGQEQARARLDAHRTAVLDAIAAQTADLEAQLAAGRERVVRGVEETVAAWVAETRERLEAQTGALTARVREDLGSLSERLGRDGAAAAEAEGAVRLQSERVAAGLAAGAEARGRDLDAARLAAEAGGADLAKGLLELDGQHARLEAGVTAVEAAAREHEAAAAADVERAGADARAGALEEALSANLEAVEETARRAHARREAELAALVRVEQSAADAEGLLRTGADAVAAGAQSVADRVSEVVDTQYRLDREADRVPARREAAARTDDEVTVLRAPSEDALVASWRNRAESGASDAGEAAEGTHDAAAAAEVADKTADEASPDEASPAAEAPQTEDSMEENTNLAGNRTLSLEVSIPSGLKPPTALSPSLAGVKRGRSAPSTPRDARASARVGVRRGTRASSRTEG